MDRPPLVLAGGEVMAGRVGRKRKAGARYPSGGLKGETIQQIKETARTHRLRLAGATVGNVDDPYWGYAAGRAYLRGQIDEAQILAADAWARTVLAYCRVKGIPSAFPRSVELMAELRGQDGRDYDESYAREVTRGYQDADLALSACGRSVKRCVMMLVKEDIDCWNWPPHQMDWLFCGLNALVDFYRIRRGKSS